MATTAKPLHRRTGEDLLRTFLGRVRTVNEDAHYLFGVRSVTLFGSLLHGSGDVADIDLVIDLEPKESDRAVHERLLQERIRSADRRFRNIVDALFWPRTEVERYLRGRSHRFSFVEKLPDGVASKLIYQFAGPFSPDGAAGVAPEFEASMRAGAPHQDHSSSRSGRT